MVYFGDQSKRTIPLHRLSVVAFGLAATIGMGTASAQTEDNPRLRAPGILIIWGADGFGDNASAPVVSDFIIDSGSGATAATSGDADLIAGDVHTVVTGILAATQNASCPAMAFHSAFSGSRAARSQLIRTGMAFSMPRTGLVHSRSATIAISIREMANWRQASTSPRIQPSQSTQLPHL